MRTRLPLLALAVVASAAGCHRRWCRQDAGPPPRLDAPTRPSGIAPQDIPAAPPSSVPSLPPPELPDSRGSFRPSDPPPASVPARPRLLEPVRPDEAPPPAAVPEREILLPDPLPGPASTSQKPATGRLGEPVRTTAGAPAGFVRLPGKDAPATGRVPTAAEADWLAANGFRTVLVLHDVRTEPPAVSGKLAVTPVPVDPADPRSAVTAVAAAGAGVYVADADADRAAAVWYAVFRTRDFVGDEVARLRVAPLGGRPERAAIWPAVR